VEQRSTRTRRRVGVVDLVDLSHGLSRFSPPRERRSPESPGSTRRHHRRPGLGSPGSGRTRCPEQSATPCGRRPVTTSPRTHATTQHRMIGIGDVEVDAELRPDHSHQLLQQPRPDRRGAFGRRAHNWTSVPVNQPAAPKLLWRPRCEVAVGVDRGSDRGVTEQLFHALHAGPSAQQPGRIGVPSVRTRRVQSLSCRDWTGAAQGVGPPLQRQGLLRNRTRRPAAALDPGDLCGPSRTALRAGWRLPSQRAAPLQPRHDKKAERK